MILFLVCVAPLRIKRLRGKKTTLRVGWDVPMKSHWWTSRSYMEHAGQQLRAGYLGYGTLPFFLHGRLLVYFTLLVYMFNWVKKMIDLEF